jgi:hypothetical protein
LDLYSPISDDWMPLASPALAGVFGAGASAVFHPSQGHRALTAGWSSPLSGDWAASFPAAVGVNQLANRGDGVGFRVRVIGKGSGSSGLTNERTIIANTAGVNPVITLDSALDWTPVSGDAIEFLSGRVFLLSAGTLAAGMWKYYDIATNSYSGNLSTTNLPGTINTDSSMVALSELHVPYDCVPGSGFVNGGATYNNATINCILATAATSTTITGSGMPSDLQTNEYVNFQIRIVEDTVTPTAVGQRALINSHTSGATGVFTINGTWAVTPSSSAKFVIENYDARILLRTSASTSVFKYDISLNSWNTTAFGASGSAPGAGVMFEQCFGLSRTDLSAEGLGRRHSHLFCFRGGNSNALDMLDIANGSTGTWSNGVTYGNQAQNFTTGACGAYDPVTRNGRYFQINVNGTQRNTRFDMLNQVMEPGTFLRQQQSTAVVGQKNGFSCFIDGSTKLGILHQIANTLQTMWSKLIQE